MKAHARTTLAAACLLALCAGCGRSGGNASAPSTAATGPTPGTYALRGEIMSVDAARKVLVVKHEEIKGVMPAMTMEFAVSAGDVAVAKPGQHIRAELLPVKDGDWRLQKIWPDDKAATDAVTMGARALRQDTLTRGREAYRDIGETVPDFTLYDQDGRVVDIARFRGKQIMLNFIYTRCPVANMCPLSTSKMMEAQKLARAAKVVNLELVSITLDPAYDTPGVLKEYAQARGIDTGNFSFLTGPESAIKDLFTQFGVIMEWDGAVPKHTLSTLLIDENGKITYRADGSQWEPKDFVAKMHKASA
jgi:protein SCO1